MNDPFITAINTQKAAIGWLGAVATNLSNLYTPGFREGHPTFATYLNGVILGEPPLNMDQGKAMPGQSPTNLMVEGKGFFVVRKDDGTLLYTRLGDFKFNPEGTLVNEAGYKVQGYLLGEDGKVVNTGNAEPSGSAAVNPNHSAGGPGHLPTTEINLWVDPGNGKFFGKYDEYKVKADGTVTGIADKGKIVDPLYKLALVSFVNPSGLAEPEDYCFAPSPQSGEPIEGEGEVRSGLLERSNTDTRDQVMFLQQARLQLDVTNKLVSTNKTLLEEALRLIQ